MTFDPFHMFDDDPIIIEQERIAELKRQKEQKAIEDALAAKKLREEMDQQLLQQQLDNMPLAGHRNDSVARGYGLAPQDVMRFDPHLVRYSAGQRVPITSQELYPIRNDLIRQGTLRISVFRNRRTRVTNLASVAQTYHNGEDMVIEPGETIEFTA
jgi:hypothetical protein